MMNTTPTRKLFVTSAVGTAFASAATTALVFLGAGTAQAIQDVSERSAAAIIDNFPTTRGCGSCAGFVPQPDPPAFPDRHSTAGIGNPNDRPITNPGNSVGLGGPDTLPPQHN
jgi:hypothetical protein